MPLGTKTQKNLVSFWRAPPTKRKSGGIPKEGQAPPWFAWWGWGGGGGGGGGTAPTAFLILLRTIDPMARASGGSKTCSMMCQQSDPVQI